MNDAITTPAASPVTGQPITVPKARAAKPAATASQAQDKAAFQPVVEAVPAAKTARKIPTKATRNATEKAVAQAPAKTLAKTPAKTPARTPAKTAAKAPVKTVAKVPSKPVAAAKARVPAKGSAPKPAKVKLLRDSFTMPSDEYAALGELKQRALASAHPVKKSELLRAGIKLLKGLSDAALLRALKNVPAIKTGRPKAKKGD